MVRLAAAGLTALAMAGCGGAPLPRPAGPGGAARLEDGRLARVDARRREVVLGGERAPAGVGPTSVAAIGTRLYVTDTVQGAVLVFRTQPRLALQRRVYAPGRPRDIHVVGDHLELQAGGRAVALTGDGAAKRIR